MNSFIWMRASTHKREINAALMPLLFRRMHRNEDLEVRTESQEPTLVALPAPYGDLINEIHRFLLR